MTELINKLVSGVGLSAEQATQSLEVIKAFVKEKLPMLSGAVDNVFGAQVDDVAAATGLDAATSYEEAVVIESVLDEPPVVEESKSWLDKISDLIPGEMGEKIEGFAKNAAVAAGEGFDKAKVVAEDLLEKGKAKLDELEKKVG